MAGQMVPRLPLLALTRGALLALAVLFSGCGGSPTAPPGARPLAYTALGASDAVGIGAIPLSAGYVFRLRDRMEGLRSPVTLSNLGINGARIEEFLADELPAALASDPDLVTVWAGPNDVIGGAAPADFAAKLDSLLSQLRAGTSAQVFVADVPDLTRIPFFRIDPDDDVTTARITEFNARIAAVVAARGCVLVPLHDLEVEDLIFSFDLFHPNNEGYERIASIFWAEIQPRL
jgi:lysophospholipase L1-like esterase